MGETKKLKLCDYCEINDACSLYRKGEVGLCEEFDKEILNSKRYKISLLTIISITLIGKTILALKLIDKFGLTTIYVVESVFLMTSFIVSIHLFINYNKSAKPSITFLILFDIINSIYMVFFYNAVDSIYFHPLCAVTYLMLNKLFVRWSWVRVIIDMYVIIIISYSFYKFYNLKLLNMDIAIHHIIAMFFIIIANLFPSVEIKQICRQIK